MLAKNRKIPKDLFAIFKQKKPFFVSNDIFNTKYIPYDGNLSLFSFTVPKKVEKSAYLRNKLKRISFDIIKDYLNFFEKPMIIWFVWKKNEKDKKIIKNSIEDILNKIK